MAITNRKLKGSTLVESVISMTLVLLIAALVFSFFIKMNTGNKVDLKMQAFLLSNEVLAETCRNYDYFDEKLTINGLTVTKEVVELDSRINVYQIIIDITDKNNTKVYSFKTIITDTRSNNPEN